MTSSETVEDHQSNLSLTEPRLIADVRREVEEHGKFADLPSVIPFIWKWTHGEDTGAGTGNADLSPRWVSLHHRWIRGIWRHLYMGEKLEDTYSLLHSINDLPALEYPKSVPKEPRLIKVVRREIEAHPNFANLPKCILFTWKLTIHDVNTEGSGMLVKLNRKWIREIWRHLYLGEELQEWKLAAEFERQLHEHHNTGPASSDQQQEGGSQSEPRTSPRPGSKRSTDDRADQGRDSIDVKVPKHD